MCARLHIGMCAPGMCTLTIKTRSSDNTFLGIGAKLLTLAMFRRWAARQFERSMTVEHVRAGAARAKASGTKSGKAFGRPRTVPEVEQRIRDALAAPGGQASTRSQRSSAWPLGLYQSTR